MSVHFPHRSKSSPSRPPAVANTSITHNMQMSAHYGNFVGTVTASACAGTTALMLCAQSARDVLPLHVLGHRLCGQEHGKRAGETGRRQAGEAGDREAGATGNREAGATGNREAGAAGSCQRLCRACTFLGRRPPFSVPACSEQNYASVVSNVQKPHAARLIPFNRRRNVQAQKLAL